ncbi:MAG: glycosyltransferase [Bacteroidota bacterium]
MESFWMDPAFFRTFLFCVFIAFAVAALVQLIFFWGVFSRLAFYKKKQPPAAQKPVSIVICARNEYLHLKKNLPIIMDQEYPDFEVVVVNDSSDDDTEFLLKAFMEQYPRLSVVHFRENRNFFSGKKFPLALGIKSAKHDTILLTEADCRPSSAFWLRNMQNAYSDSANMVLGYSRIEQNKGLFDKMIRFDAVFRAMKYLSYAMAGMPYTGVGKNLSYTKTLFYKSKGFISHYTIRFGDDDLFVNRNASALATRVELSPESHTVSTTTYTFSRWVKKRKRQLTTARYYSKKHKFILGSFTMTQLLFYLCFIPLVIWKVELYIVLGLFGLRMASALIVFKRCMKTLHEQKLLLYLPLFELMLVFLTPLLSLSASVVKQDKWK